MEGGQARVRHDPNRDSPPVQAVFVIDPNGVVELTLPSVVNGSAIFDEIAHHPGAPESGR